MEHLICALHTHCACQIIADDLRSAHNIDNIHCRALLSNALLLLWIVLLSVVLTVVADRFFCPALEVLSDYFQLPANVAGATLLSFGNGAPDVFTQLAAVATVRTRPFRTSSRALEADAFARSLFEPSIERFCTQFAAECVCLRIRKTIQSKRTRQPLHLTCADYQQE